jgi:drug/metabolite transporter (DMT)-like permease
MANVWFYILGVFLAIISGILNNYGTVLQKKVVNKFRTEPDFMKKVVKNRLWLWGLVLQLVLGSAFFMAAQLFIGPALIPGLMAAGLIVLAIGSVKIVGESLNKTEIIGIIVMIIGVFLLGLSETSIDIMDFDVMETGYLIRTGIFTGTIILFSVGLYIWQRKNTRWRAILLSIVSGFQFVLSNYWISPLMAIMEDVFTGNAQIGEIIIFVISSLILVGTQIIGIGTLQNAFKTGQASNLVPIQQVPIQILPLAVYFYVFLQTPVKIISYFYMIAGVTGIIISSFLLGKRQAQIEEIGKSEDK